ncbi:enoyl-CoA hydratase/isomerase family protein [Sphingomonas sp. CFBP 8765]|jgi:2-(1,2-epoxy-1,2-dihydrophenyl)acetyl-CoA isomerase|uniref:enoyl-CoA hydratase/isomerase family protein n=1 Tax=Sphingomonas sp. CFBP 8765 TaxID=2775274 RepID=UPI001784ED0F|nr:enoyl-CoA hydratase-related protein [Sphingomonas sp. CFBP 8765]MBD8472356.1 enoyl-CoA hydratase/isomerase family protein [Sphingomonas sp. CFBP 8765]
MNGLLFERVGPVAWLTLDRPDAANAIDVLMAKALMETTIECDEDPAIRCVILTGNGRMFCAGGDVAGFAKMGDALPAHIKQTTAYLHAAITRLARMDKPLITAVNGPAAGAGIGLAVIGDIVLAAPEAHFTMAYTALGMSPDGGTSWLVPRLVGLRRAQELFFCNTRVLATEAAKMGLVTRVVEGGSLREEATALAEKLVTSATLALGATRRLLFDSLVTPLETHLDAEARSIASQSRRSEGREGIAAFLSKRKPTFQGAS